MAMFSTLSGKGVKRNDTISIVLERVMVRC